MSFVSPPVKTTTPTILYTKSGTVNKIAHTKKNKQKNAPARVAQSAPAQQHVVHADAEIRAGVRDQPAPLTLELVQLVVR